MSNPLPARPHPHMSMRLSSDFCISRIFVAATDVRRLDMFEHTLRSGPMFALIATRRFLGLTILHSMSPALMNGAPS
jgi:hypothetical protein